MTPAREFVSRRVASVIWKLNVVCDTTFLSVNTPEGMRSPLTVTTPLGTAKFVSTVLNVVDAMMLTVAIL